MSFLNFLYGSSGTYSRYAMPVSMIALLMACIVLPFVLGEFWTYVATRFLIYWVVVSGLSLIVGYAGQLAIGYVAVLAIGAYTACYAVGPMDLNPYVAAVVAAAFGGLAGLIVGLPAIRLKTFYFAMATIGATQIVVQVAFAWRSVTGGGMGISAPLFSVPFHSPNGFYYLCLIVAAVATFLTMNIAMSRYGRSLVALRDADVAAEACGISKSRTLFPILIFAGVLTGIAGTLFASMQTHITPEAFNLDLSLLFFIAILVGGQGSIVGPLFATAVLTVLPEIAAPLAAWSTFIYAAMLLVITLLVPGGIAELVDRMMGKRPPANRTIVANSQKLSHLIDA